MGGRAALAPYTCCEHELEALGLCLVGGWAPRDGRLSPPSHLCHRQGSVADLAGTPAQPSPSWVSSGMMMTLPPYPPPCRRLRHKNTPRTGRRSWACSHPRDTRMPAVRRQGASPPGGTSKCAVHEKGAAEWLGTDNLKSFLNFKSIYLGNSNIETLEKYIIDRQTRKRFTRTRAAPSRRTGGDSSLLRLLFNEQTRGQGVREPVFSPAGC